MLKRKTKTSKHKEELKKFFLRDSGGIIFTTIQKFAESQEPLLTRENIIIAADEAHRTQYGFKAKVNKETGEIKYGFAKYLRDALPNASFIGFTGTPIEFEDKSTKAVFGNYIDIYDIEQAVEDKRTVRIYYESRLAKLELNNKEIKHLDEDFEEITEDEEEKQKLKNQWTQLEKIVGSESRIKQIVSKAVSSEGVIDVFEVAGIEKPEISILSDKFLDEVKAMKHKNLAFEALKKLLADQIRIRFKQNKIKNRKFSEMLEEVIRRYQNRSIDSAQVIQELIEIAK